MKLRDLVANSLPRVRGKKKKSTEQVPQRSELMENVGHCTLPSSDRMRSKGDPRILTSNSGEDSLDCVGVSESSWRGNVLYRGLQAARAGRSNTKVMSTSYTTAHGMVTSHSAEGFSSHLTLMTQSYDSRLTVPEGNDSCPHMSFPGVEAAAEPCSPPQQHYHCHYHRHDHHHYHYNHPNSKPMAQLPQNQQVVHPDFCGQGPNLKEIKTSEPGFFRKSFASFRAIRKHSSKASKDPTPCEADQTVCSACPYPDPPAMPAEKRSTDKRPVKPKRKTLKGFTKQKENKEAALPLDACAASRYSENDLRYKNTPSYRCDEDNSKLSKFATVDRSYVRERSVESCSSRLFGSREGSSVREVDGTGFDSASLSGYESDFSRNKVHRSRSRIKTNPWLPSPQLSTSGGSRGERCELRESTEDVAVIDDLAGRRVPRSASFDHQRDEAALLQKEVYRSNSFNQRSLTPIDVLFSANLSSLACPQKPEYLKESSASCIAEHSRLKNDSSGPLSRLNNLSSETAVSRCRPGSTISPNSEFVLLADNLEQLANNISFEYEEMLDTTLESVSIGVEDGQASIQELLTDEENGNASKGFHKTDGEHQNAHSPDSGVCGLGSTDGDEAGTPNAQPDLSSSIPMDFCPSVQSLETKDDSNLNGSASNKVRNQSIDKFSTGSLPLICDDRLSINMCDLSNQESFNSKCHSTKDKPMPDKCYVMDTDNSATLSESDIDNTSYQDNDSTLDVRQKSKEKADEKVLAIAAVAPSSTTSKSNLTEEPKTGRLMVEERLDFEFRPNHRVVHGSGILMGTVATLKERGHHLGINSKPKQAGNNTYGRTPRPIAFKDKFSTLDLPSKFNNMHKSSIKSLDRSEVSIARDFPKNIGVSDNVESPTDNWQCGEKLSDSIRDLDTFDGLEANRANSKQEPLIPEELFVSLDSRKLRRSSWDSHIGVESSRSSHAVVEEISCVLEDLACQPVLVNWKRNDASVQTDFDEDFSRWDEAETLQNLEDKALDPAESTRLWLLTGSMQDSTDTGYFSLTRDSQILLEEDGSVGTGQPEEVAAAERLSYIDPGEDLKTIRDGGSSDDIVTCSTMRHQEKHGKKDGRAFQVGNTSYHSFGETMGQQSALPQQENTISVLQEMSSFGANGGSVLQKATPRSKLNTMFSSIESQFQEIFQQIKGDDKSLTHAEKRISSDSSDSTLKTSDPEDASDLSQFAASCINNCPKTKDLETGETKIYIPNTGSKHVALGKECANFVLVNMSNHNNPVLNKYPQPSTKGIGLVHNKHPERYFSLPDQYATNRARSSNPEIKAPNNLSTAIIPNPERADYLEFLRDTPLNRPHLKRPLFLVPGLGPVDMSTTEQLNLFSDRAFVPDKNSQPPNVLSSSQASSNSPSTSHSGKKLKYKKKEHTSECVQQSLIQHPPVGDRRNSQSRTSSSGHSHLASLHRSDSKSHPNFPNADRAAVRSSPAVLDSRSATSYISHPVALVHPFAAPYGVPSSSFQFTSAPILTKEPVKSMNTSPPKKEPCINLKEKVLSLQKEKDVVFQKIHAARQDEKTYTEQRPASQKHAQVQRKEALLGSLQELKAKLEEQSKLLLQRETSERK